MMQRVSRLLQDEENYIRMTENPDIEYGDVDYWYRYSVCCVCIYYDILFIH